MTVLTITATGAGSITVGGGGANDPASGVTSIIVECWGPGTAAAAGASAKAGGQGGNYSKSTLTVTNGDILYYNCAAATASGVDGSSWVHKNTNTLAGADVAATVRGLGGTNTGTTLVSGGDGGSAQGGGGSRGGSGGGGSAGVAGNTGAVGAVGVGAAGGAGGNGDNGSGGAGGPTSGNNGTANILGGGGGAGGAGAGGTGGNGGAPGGAGGGGGSSSGVSGSGSRGQVQFTYTNPAPDTSIGGTDYYYTHLAGGQ